MANNKRNILTDFQLVNKTIAPGANLGFVENIYSLTDLIEGLSTDGQMPLIKRIRMHFRSHLADTASTVIVALQPIVVQCSNGNFADTVNLVVSNINTVLASACADEFGFQKLGPIRIARPMGKAVFNVTTQLKYGIEFSIDVPQNIITLLNKEVNTERLQDIFIGFVGVVTSNLDVAYAALIETEFSLRTKGITIR